MEQFKLVLRVLLPSTLCILINYTIKIPLEYSTLLFGFIIGVVNWNYHKLNSFLGILLSITFSFACYVIAYLSLFITLPIFNSFGGEKGSIIGLKISMYIISPLLIFYLFKYIFIMIINPKLTAFIISLSVTLLILQSYFFAKFPMIETRAFNPQTMWQAIMALALQFIIYQKKIKELFKPKKSNQ